MPLTRKQSREALGIILTKLLELKSDFPIQNILIHNDCEHIEDFVIINDGNISYLYYPTGINALDSLLKVHHNLIRMFIDYFWYQIHDSDPISNDWVQVTNNNFGYFHIMDCDTFIRLCNSGPENYMSNSTTSSFKSY